MRQYSDIIGNALGMYYPGQRVVFGGDVADPSVQFYGNGSAAPMAVAPQGYPQGGWGACNPFGFGPYQGGADQAGLMRGLASHNSLVVGDNCGPKAVNMPLPFPATTIPASGSVVINVTPQMLYTPTSLGIPSTIASALVVNDITIGTASQFAAIGPVPAMAFIETATYKGLTFDTCLPNQPIQVEIENITNAEIDLYAWFEGAGVRGFGPQIYSQLPR